MQFMTPDYQIVNIFRGKNLMPRHLLRFVSLILLPERCF